MVGNIIPLMSRMCDNLTDQFSKIVDQVRGLQLPDQLAGGARRDARLAIEEFQKLRPNNE